MRAGGGGGEGGVGGWGRGRALDVCEMEGGLVGGGGGGGSERQTDLRSLA